MNKTYTDRYNQSPRGKQDFPVVKNQSFVIALKDATSMRKKQKKFNFLPTKEVMIHEKHKRYASTQKSSAIASIQTTNGSTVKQQYSKFLLQKDESK